MGANWKKFVSEAGKRFGYGQVEPTHLSAQRTSQIYAQLPADDFDLLENGQFVVYDYAKEKCVAPANATVSGTEPFMVWNEIKLYDEREQMYKDYAMVKSTFTPGSASIKHDATGTATNEGSGYVDADTFSGYGPLKGQMVPRVIKTNVGDVMITNTLTGPSKDNYAQTDISNEIAADFLKVDAATGYLVKATQDEIANEVMIWAVDKTKTFTMPDGQPAVKIQRIK